MKRNLTILVICVILGIVGYFGAVDMLTYISRSAETQDVSEDVTVQEDEWDGTDCVIIHYTRDAGVDTPKYCTILRDVRVLDKPDTERVAFGRKNGIVISGSYHPPLCDVLSIECHSGDVSTWLKAKTGISLPRCNDLGPPQEWRGAAFHRRFLP